MVAETNPNHAAMATGAYGGDSGIPGNAFAVYGKTDGESCPTGTIDESKPPTETSGESPACIEAETFFETVAKGPRAKEITTSGIFGKPKLGRLFAKRSGGRYVADDLWAPCENQGDDPPYCERVPINPATGQAAEDRIVMDEVVQTVDQGVAADGTRKRPNLTFVNFNNIDAAGHATGTGSAYDTAISRADDQIERFVENQKRLGLWKRTLDDRALRPLDGLDAREDLAHTAATRARASTPTTTWSSRTAAPRWCIWPIAPRPGASPSSSACVPRRCAAGSGVSASWAACSGSRAPTRPSTASPTRPTAATRTPSRATIRPTGSSTAASATCWSPTIRAAPSPSR